MIAEAKNENSTFTGNVVITTPTITNAYITVGTKTVVKPKKEGESERTIITLDKKYNKGLYGRSYFLVIETKNFLDTSKAKFKVSLCSKTKVLSDPDTSFKVLITSSDTSSIEIPYNNYFNDEQIANKIEFKNKAIMEFSFDRENEEDREVYKLLISQTENKKAPLYIKIDEVIDGGSDIVYEGDKISEEQKCFYFESNYDLVEECLCSRKMTEQELKDIVIAFNKGKEKLLFRGQNCDIKQEDATYQNLTDALNSTFEKYELNTCNRIAHFLAQVCHESGNFNTTKEIAEGKNYELINWENRKEELEDTLAEIDTLKPKIDIIINRLKQTAINVDKNQQAEVDSKITSESKITEDEQETINSYKAIFEKKWTTNLDMRATVVYDTREKYDFAINGKPKSKSNPTLEGGAVQKIANIKAQGHTELGDGARYKGRGIMQLTWRSAYVSYFNFVRKREPIPESIKTKTIEQILNRKDDDMALLLSSDVFYAVDSAGWFWLKYKGNSLPGAADYDGNTLAPVKPYKDYKTIEKISRIVNGGTNGLSDRINKYNKLRDEIFMIKSVCINFDKIK